MCAAKTYKCGLVNGKLQYTLFSRANLIFNERIFLCLPHEKCVDIFGDPYFVVLSIHVGIVREQSLGKQHAV